jgi:membrane fusion protein, multidrug efflux system
MTDHAANGPPAGMAAPHGAEVEQEPVRWWPWLVAGGALLALTVAVLYMIFAPHAEVETEDAYVTARFTTVAPRVSGQISALNVDDNQQVKKGQVLAIVDQEDFQISLSKAQAALEANEAKLDQATVQIERQPAIIRKASAAVAAARSGLTQAEADATRFGRLAVTGAGSEQQAQKTAAARDEARAQFAAATADLENARRDLKGLRADQQATRAAIAADRATIAQAKTDLGRTTVTAPMDGTIDQRTVQVGNFVQAGTPIMAIVPLDSVYIRAQFLETKLRHMRPGQHAHIHVDAYDVELDGVVQSLAAGSGAAFSPIPPTNASGNFTKVTQRLPVKIMVSPNQPLARLLRLGMSVTVKVDTGLSDVVGDQGKSAERVTAWH